MSSRNRNNLPNNLAQLQNVIKKDPDSYKEEFLQQWKHFVSNLELFQLDPTKESQSISESVTFLAQVASCYQDDLLQLPKMVMDLLSQHYSIMNPEVRMTLCRALILLRNKNLVEPLQLLELFFKLLKANDKLLRKTLHMNIINDIKNINLKRKNNKLNTSLQNFMFAVLKDSHPIATKISLEIMIELYRRQIWNDSKTVNVIVTACFSKITKVMVTALTFFLGSDTPENVNESDSESEDEREKLKTMISANQVSKKTAKKAKKLEKALKSLKKSKKNSKPVSFNFSAIHLINDPQGFAEKLFKQVEVSTERFEVKLMMMNLIARLVGVHELILLNYYPYLLRFLQPHQREVTKLLMFAAQSSHELVPPDAIEPVLMAIANNFVSEKNSTEVMAVGLNAIREICNRCPLAMSTDLLQDLVQYKSTKNKAVMMAARSLLQLYRNYDSSMLRRKDRGKPTDENILETTKAKEYGAINAQTFVSGTEHLNSAEEDGGEEDSDVELSDDSGGWIDISHSEDEEDKEEIDEHLENEVTEDDLYKRAETVSQTRILTNEDFKRIREKSLGDHAQVKTTSKSKTKNRKRKFNVKSDGSNLNEQKEFVKLSEIENIHKKAKHDKESRLATVIAGREGREKYGQPKKKRQNEFASTTNREKLKKKPFMMISHSQKSRVKGKKSFREKQIALRNALLKKEGKKRK